MHMNDREELLFNLWFTNIPAIGLRRRAALRKHFGSVEKIYGATYAELRRVLPSDELVNNIIASRNPDTVKRFFDELVRLKIKAVFPGHPLYPDKLINIYDAPDILYLRGIMWDEDHIHNNKSRPSIGIVGSRNPDAYGRELSEYFARELAAQGVIVISGLARGVDSAAHRGAIKGGGYTIAVLGCGLNITYPPENAALYNEIEQSGVIVSEYRPDVMPSAGNFPARNRIISGMSDGVLVVQAKKRSGSLITADCALEQGRQVYAIPGRALDPCYEGGNNLIKQGAYCVTAPQEILDDICMSKGIYNMCELSGCDRQMISVQTHDGEARDDKNILAPMEKKVYSCLGLEPMYIDDIIQHCDIGITGVISTLYGLEEKGKIRQPVRGYYIIAL